MYGKSQSGQEFPEARPGVLTLVHMMREVVRDLHRGISSGGGEERDRSWAPPSVPSPRHSVISHLPGRVLKYR